jgi:hypothetical protein
VCFFVLRAWHLRVGVFNSGVGLGKIGCRRSVQFLGALGIEIGCDLLGFLRVGVRFLVRASVCVVIGGGVVEARCIDTVSDGLLLCHCW